MLTLTGAGGVGKTRLARRVAESLLSKPTEHNVHYLQAKRDRMRHRLPDAGSALATS